MYVEGDLKSAMQKFIRRGLSDRATQAGLALFRKSSEAFCRRIIIVAAEDVGPDSIIETGEIVRKVRELVKTGQRELSEQLVIRAIRNLAESKHEKSACWVVDLGRDKWNHFIPEWKDLLVQAIDDRSAPDIAGLGICGLNAVGIKPVFDLFGEKAVSRGVTAVRTIEILRSRASLTARSCDTEILIGCAALVLIRFEPKFYEVPSLTDPLESYCFDLHTGLGRQVLSLAARKLGMSAERLGYLQFLCDGMQIENEAETEMEFRADAYKTIFRKHLGIAKVEADEEWQRVKPELERIAEWVMSRTMRAPGSVDEMIT